MFPKFNLRTSRLTLVVTGKNAAQSFGENTIQTGGMAWGNPTAEAWFVRNFSRIFTPQNLEEEDPA